MNDRVFPPSPNFIVRWWRNYQRTMDLAILWPACCDASISRNHALRMFMAHCRQDAAWRVPIGEMSAEQRTLVEAIINNEYGEGA
jgi:hypothetical protein